MSGIGDVRARVSFALSSNLISLLVRQGLLTKADALDFLDGLIKACGKTTPPDVEMIGILKFVREGIAAQKEPERQ